MVRKPQSIILSVIVSTAAVLIVFVTGYQVGHATKSPVITPATGGSVLNTDSVPDFLTKDVDFKQFWEIWQYVKENYVKSDVPDTQLFYGALSGMVASLDDPYSVYLRPDISKKFEEELSGSFDGIGAEIGIKNNQLAVIAPLPGTPADTAGLRAGDYILAIDGKDTTNIALDFAVSQIRGKKGTEVVLTVIAEGDKEPHDVKIVRDKIEIDSVRVVRQNGTKREITPATDDTVQLLDGNIAYVQLLYFNENTLADWNKTIQKVITLNPKGIILDLRNDPGGFLGTAIEVAGDWVDGKTVVMEQLRSGERVQHGADHQARLAGVPTVVLINKGSASGSEIVAGALQDYQVATLVGETSFGKGSVQDLHDFKDGSSVKLTIAEWLTPNGRNINKEGIKPDVEVKMTRDDYDHDRDPQLDKALEILRKK